MCGLIVLLILLCELPYFVCAVIEMFILLPLPLLATISTMRDCTCAIKPIVFLTCSTQFRDGLFKMFEKLIRPRKAKVEDVVYGNAISLSRPRRFVNGNFIHTFHIKFNGYITCISLVLLLPIIFIYGLDIEGGAVHR